MSITVIVLRRHRTLVWEKIINEDEPLIVIGTRSAVFLPIQNLGLIVMDEEHDISYKQDSPMPCYDARDVALEESKKKSSKVNFWKCNSFNEDLEKGCF